ncbi:MAG TPA: adenylosuccinate synthase [Terracidiphilus sp.]|nr:adenylosuccinate synthase [Terracidiphilus sp.]
MTAGLGFGRPTHRTMKLCDGWGTGKRQKQIPCGNDRKKSKSKSKDTDNGKNQRKYEGNGKSGINLQERMAMRAKTAVVLGAQWGDEGKGKIVDVLSERFSAVARYAGGHNAGHTVIIGGQRFVLQLIPCGVLRKGCAAVIGNGVVLDPIAFLAEVARLREFGVDVDGQLKVSNRAQVILPYHRMMELAAESAPGRKKIGTTSRGIGPAYEDKMARSGLRVVDLLDTKLLKTHIEAACAEKNRMVQALFGSESPLDPGAMFDEYAAAAEKVRPFVADTGRLLNRILRDGGSVMFEGAQGTMLDIDHGTYPFVTSSSATAGGASTGTGVGPTAIGTVIGVTKAYVTRVGGGPFPSEIHDGVGEQLRARGNEYGAVTGRPRRCGWLDIPLLRYSNQVNGAEWLVVTKLDVLDELEEIPVCVGYEIGGRVTDEVPADVEGLESLTPVYTKLKGWQEPTEGIRDFERLPAAAQEYLRFQERESGARIGMVSTGPDRDQTMVLPEFAAALEEIHR